MEIKEQIEDIMKKIKPTANLNEVKDIIDGGYLDSLELMGLITSLMEGFNIEIEIEDISPENFNSVNAMVTLVERLRMK